MSVSELFIFAGHNYVTGPYQSTIVQLSFLLSWVGSEQKAGRHISNAYSTEGQDGVEAGG